MPIVYAFPLHAQAQVNTTTTSIRKLEDQLNCSVCLYTYTDPKLLGCFHVYCQKCLMKLVDRDQQGQLFLSCPNCRQVTPVPANGVAGLQSAFLITPLLEIVEEHKKATSNQSSASAKGELTSLAPPAVVSMSEKKWSSSVSHVRSPSAWSMLLKAVSISATRLNYSRKPLRSIRERLHHQWRQWRSN